MATLKLETKELRKEVMRQVAKKISLETRLKPKIKKFLRTINKEVATRYESTGTIGDLDKYTPELIAILKEHYRLTQKRFMGEYEIKGDIEKATDLLMEEFIDEQAPKQAGFIMDTTRKETMGSLAATFSDFAGEPVIVGTAFAKGFLDNMNSKVAGRAEIISMTETQTTAERTKLTEAMVNAGDITAGNIPLQPKKNSIKTWHTACDSSVRGTHKEANGQTKPLNEPFIVGGSRLMFPGDTSLFADPREIYNCRCVSITRVEA